MKRLWEVEHPYYCQETNYFSKDLAHEWDSWTDFFEEMGDSDKDLNLVFRFDWFEGDENDIPEGEARLVVFFMGQRKGLFSSHTVKLTREDEPAARAWLAERWEHMRALWTPFSGVTPAD